MYRFKNWLIPIAAVCFLLASLFGVADSEKPSLGLIFDPSGNPFAHRFSDVTDKRAVTLIVAASDSVHKYEADYKCNGSDDQDTIQLAIDSLPVATREVVITAAALYDAPAYTDQEYEATEGTDTDDVTLLPAAPVVGDAYYFCGQYRFQKLKILISTQGVADTITLVWEYWNGTAWAALAGVTDGTSNFQAATGWRDVTFTNPATWRKHHLDPDLYFYGWWIRARLSAYANGTYVQPKATQVLIEIDAGGGEVHLLDGTYEITADIVLPSNVTFSGCGPNTVLKISDATDTDVYMFVNDDQTNGNINIVIRDLKMDGNLKNQSTGAWPTHQGIAFDKVSYSEFSQLSIEHFLDRVISCESLEDTVIRDNKISKNWSRGIYFRFGYDNLVKGNVVSDGKQGTSLQIRDSYRCIFEGNTLKANSGGAYLQNCHDCIVSNNFIAWNETGGIDITSTSTGLSIVDNTVHNNKHTGIRLNTGDNITISGNHVYQNDEGGTTYSGIEIINMGPEATTVSGNFISGNGDHGIRIYRASYTTVVGNVCNNQNTGDGIHIEGDVTDDSSHNLVVGNTCMDNAAYGINIIGAAFSINNTVKDCKLRGNASGSFSDAGTNTHLATYVVPFSDGSDPQDSGYEIDAGAEIARAWARLPAEVQQVVRMNIYARSVVLEADAMRLEINVNGGADNEPYDTHATAAPDTPSTSTNFAADDVIYWSLSSAEIVALLGGDSVEIKVLHEAAGNGDCETDAFLRTVEFEYL